MNGGNKTEIGYRQIERPSSCGGTENQQSALNTTNQTTRAEEMFELPAATPSPEPKPYANAVQEIISYPACSLVLSFSVFPPSHLLLIKSRLLAIESQWFTREAKVAAFRGVIQALSVSHEAWEPSCGPNSLGTVGAPCIHNGRIRLDLQLPLAS